MPRCKDGAFDDDDIVLDGGRVMLDGKREAAS